MEAGVAGALVSAGVTIVVLILHKARCILRCGNNEEQEHNWSCAAGFTDSSLENKDLETLEFPENALIYRKA